MPTATTLPSGSAKYAASSPQPRSDSWRFRQPSSGLWETDDKPFAFHLELSSHCVEHSRADSGAEVLEVVAKRNGAHAVCHGPDRHGRAVDDELARVGLARLDVEAAGLDPCHGSEEVEQLGHLLRGGADHVDVTVGRALERVEALQRVRESRSRRERRPEVVARE